MNFAFVFPGQGSQKIGMFGDYNLPSIIKMTFDEASEVAGKNLLDLTKEGPLDELNKTVNTQMVMLASGVGFYRYWREQGGAQPTVLAGHSLGEYAALVSGGALTYGNAAKLVHERATLMQEAVPEGVGAIAAIIGLPGEEVEQFCLQASDTTNIVQPANYNSPTQTVVAGNKPAVELAIKLMSENGAKKAIMLPMSVPSHCALLSSMLDKFEDSLSKVNIKEPSIPILQNASINAEAAPEVIKKNLLYQVVKPVFWTKTIEKMTREYKVLKIVEIGPSKVLTGLNKRINKTLEAFAFDQISSLPETISKLG